jgi:3-hydroxyacyl-CoA dehydrogenase
MLNRKINKIAIIGSGIMGSGIACHFANIGVEVSSFIGYCSI